jgi:DNA invertase Pin-like site-specific DNA recombinase
MGKRTMTGVAGVAVAYIRVSTDDQRLGPEAQRAAIETWAAREGVHVAAWHVDVGVSGATVIEARPGLCAALASLRDHAAGLLVVAKRDRIARDVVVAAMAERAAVASGARLVAADGTANGDSPADAFMRTVIDGAAAYERGLIRARTKAALAAKSSRGERVSGGIPFGFRLATDSVHLEQVVQEQQTIARARMLASEDKSLREIASNLAIEGYVSRTGRPFAPTQVARMLAHVEAPTSLPGGPQELSTVGRP